MFAQAVEDVLGDDSLQLPSPIAAAALQVGKILRAWCQDAANQCLLCYFSSPPSREGIEPNFLQIPPKEGENVGLVFCYSHIQRICEEMDRFFGVHC